MLKRLIPGKRWVKLIDVKQQLRFALEVVVLTLAFPMLFYILTVNPKLAHFFFGSQALELSQAFHQHFLLLAQAWHVALIILLFIVIVSVFFSNKIFGPMYRFKTALEEKMDGEKNIHAKIRTGDYFQSFSELIQQITANETTLLVSNDTRKISEEDKVKDVVESGV